MQTFDTPGPVSLRVRIPSGRVVVTTTHGDLRTEVELVAQGRGDEAALEQIDVTHDERSGRHVVVVEQRDQVRWRLLSASWGGGVEVRVSCPAGTELELSGAATEFRAEGQFGDVSVRTASGDIRLGALGGKVEVKTASGEVSIESIESDSASAVTVSGDLDVGRIDGRLTVRTVSGDVELGVCRGPLAISTTSGDVRLGSLEAGELRIQSVSGDCRVAVGRGTKVWVDASSLSGELSSELAIGDETPEGDSAASSEVVPIHVKTVSGDVALVRVAAHVG